ncbi:MAG TPA: hypothetical protein VM689_01600 [Aliidongia sp.]|nr:hypothetical protein [Aliidongia sp.]
MLPENDDPAPNNKRKASDERYEEVEDGYFLHVMAWFEKEYGVKITPKKAKQFIENPFKSPLETIKEVNAGGDEDIESESDDDGDVLGTDLQWEFDESDFEDGVLVEDFVALPPCVPNEILMTLKGRRLDLGDYPERNRGSTTSSDMMVEEDAIATPSEPVTFAAALAAQQAWSVVFDYVFEPKGAKDPALVDKFSQDPRAATTFYSMVQMGDPNQPPELALPQMARIGDFEQYLDTDEAESPKQKSNDKVTSEGLRVAGNQGPHTVAYIFAYTAFKKRLEQDREEAETRLHENDESSSSSMDEDGVEEHNKVKIIHSIASWEALDGMLVKYARLPSDALIEVEDNISSSRKAGSKAKPRQEPVAEDKRALFIKKIRTAMGRMEELFLQIDVAIQSGKELALQARKEGWREDVFDQWVAIDEEKLAITERLLFEYKNMEPLATYAWNEWRKATTDEIKGKGERSPEHYINCVITAGLDKTQPVDEAAKDKWDALLDLADYGSKLIDGTSSMLDGDHLWNQIQRELELVDPDSGELLSKLVELCGVFPSFVIQPSKYGNPKGKKKMSKEAKAQRKQMEDLQKSIVDGTIRLAAVKSSLKEKRNEQAFERRQIQNPMSLLAKTFGTEDLEIEDEIKDGENSETGDGAGDDDDLPEAIWEAADGQPVSDSSKADEDENMELRLLIEIFKRRKVRLAQAAADDELPGEEDDLDDDGADEKDMEEEEKDMEKEEKVEG